MVEWYLTILLFTLAWLLFCLILSIVNIIQIQSAWSLAPGAHAGFDKLARRWSLLSTIGLAVYVVLATAVPPSHAESTTIGCGTVSGHKNGLAAFPWFVLLGPLIGYGYSTMARRAHRRGAGLTRSFLGLSLGLLLLPIVAALTIPLGSEYYYSSRRERARIEEEKARTQLRLEEERRQEAELRRLQKKAAELEERSR